MNNLKFLINVSSEHLIIIIFIFLSFVLSILQKQTLDVAKQDMTTSTEGE